MNFLSEALRGSDRIIADRRALHSTAEVGFDLPRTAAHVKARLQEMGLSPVDLCACGFYADVTGSAPGKTILVRADMDALPMDEESGLDFASAPGACHACGHDIHTAVTLGAAEMLVRCRGDFKGRVRLMFQPSEEDVKGAVAMIENGLLEDVDAVLGMHVAIGIPAGYFRLLPGPILASSDLYRIDVGGRGGHGSAPELSVDPINIGAHIHLAFQEIIAREIAAQDPAVITIGKFQAGTAPNIIPESATLAGTLRAFSREARAKALRRMDEISRGTAAAFGGSAVFTVTSATPATYNDRDFVREMIGYMKEVAGDGRVITEGPSQMASDDFAYLTEKRPGAMMHLGMGDAAGGYTVNVHNPKVRFDEEGIAPSAAVIAGCLCRWLQNNG